MPHYTVSDAPDAVLKNKPGAKTHDELERLESKYVFARNVELLMGHGPTGSFDDVHLKAIHRHLFQDVFEWAGRSRDERVVLSDGTVAMEPLLRKPDGQPFLPGPLISKALADINTKLRAFGYLRGLPRPLFAERAAGIFAAVNTAHAFRDGNGRTQRVFMGKLAEQAGYELDFSVISRERMVQASIAASEQGDLSLMVHLFDEITTPSRIAALMPAVKFLEQQDFPWNDTFIATTQPGKSMDVTLVGVAGEHFMGRTPSGIVVGQAVDLPTPRPRRGERFHLEPSAWLEAPSEPKDNVSNPVAPECHR